MSPEFPSFFQEDGDDVSAASTIYVYRKQVATDFAEGNNNNWKTETSRDEKFLMVLCEGTISKTLAVCTKKWTRCVVW